MRTKLLRAEILHEDPHVVVVNKPAGALVQADRTGDDCLRDQLSEWYRQKGENDFIGVVHRLDRPVSGITLFARNPRTLAALNRQFKSGRVVKTYWALTTANPPAEAGRLQHFLLKDPKRNVVRVVRKTVPGAKKAVLDYELVARIGRFYLLEIRPYTGRPHQIRAQLAAMRCPIVGDLKYGFPKPNPDQSICLHARTLEFQHPTAGASMRLRADLPTQPPWNLFAGF